MRKNTSLFVLSLLMLFVVLGGCGGRSSVRIFTFYDFPGAQREHEALADSLDKKFQKMFKHKPLPGNDLISLLKNRNKTLVELENELKCDTCEVLKDLGVQVFTNNLAIVRFQKLGDLLQARFDYFNTSKNRRSADDYTPIYTVAGVDTFMRKNGELDGMIRELKKAVKKRKRWKTWYYIPTGAAAAGIICLRFCRTDPPTPDDELPDLGVPPRGGDDGMR